MLRSKDRIARMYGQTFKPKNKNTIAREISDNNSDSPIFSPQDLHFPRRVIHEIENILNTLSQAEEDRKALAEKLEELSEEKERQAGSHKGFIDKREKHAKLKKQLEEAEAEWETAMMEIEENN